MTTTTLTEPTTIPNEELLIRPAVRFLLAHRLGRLLTDDPATGEPHVTPVRYVPDDRGGLLTYLPADSDHARALGRGGSPRSGASGDAVSVSGGGGGGGGASLLSVDAAHARVPDELIDVDGLATVGAIRHVQADVQVELIEDARGVEEVLRLQIAGASDPLPPREEAAPANPATPLPQAALVGVRLRLVHLRPRLRSSLLEVEAGPVD